MKSNLIYLGNVENSSFRIPFLRLFDALYEHWTGHLDASTRIFEEACGRITLKDLDGVAVTAGNKEESVVRCDGKVARMDSCLLIADASEAAVGRIDLIDTDAIILESM